MSNPEYNDLINATISNNMLNIEYKDNINNLEYLNIYNSQIPKLPINFYLVTIGINNSKYINSVITNDDKLIVLVEDVNQKTYLVKFRLNDTNTYEEYLQYNISQIDKQLLDLPTNTKIIISENLESLDYNLNKIQIDYKNRLILFGKVDDYSGYVLSRININNIVMGNTLLSQIYLNVDITKEDTFRCILDNHFGEIIDNVYGGFTKQLYPIYNSTIYNNINNITADYLNRIILIFDDGRNNYILRRFTEDGQPDTTFNQINISSTTNLFILLQSNNLNDSNGFYLIYTTNQIEPGENPYLVSKYRNDGTEDTTFSNNFINGKDFIYYNNLILSYTNFITILQNFFNISNNNLPEILNIDNNDKILLSAQINPSNNDPSYALIARYNQDGTPDNTMYDGTNYIINNNYGVGYYNFQDILIDSHNNIIIGYDSLINVTIPSLILYNDNGIINDKSRYYNQISFDNGTTFQFMNNTRRNYSQNGKNTLSVNLNNIPNTNNRNYAIQLKTSDEKRTNIITLNDTEAVSKYQFELVLKWMSSLFRYMARLI